VAKSEARNSGASDVAASCVTRMLSIVVVNGPVSGFGVTDARLFFAKAGDHVAEALPGGDLITDLETASDRNEDGSRGSSRRAAPGFIYVNVH
jgi:hypothetical protein